LVGWWFRTEQTLRFQSRTLSHLTLTCLTPTRPHPHPQVVLRGARDLPVWGLPWQSNPAARLTLGGQAVVSRRDAETSQPSRHRAPQWNQEFQFLVEDPDAQVRRLWCCCVRIPRVDIIAII
jgi:hypothetical protein